MLELKVVANDVHIGLWFEAFSDLYLFGRGVWRVSQPPKRTSWPASTTFLSQMRFGSVLHFSRDTLYNFIQQRGLFPSHCPREGCFCPVDMLHLTFMPSEDFKIVAECGKSTDWSWEIYSIALRDVLYAVEAIHRQFNHLAVLTLELTFGYRNICCSPCTVLPSFIKFCPLFGSFAAFFTALDSGVLLPFRSHCDRLVPRLLKDSSIGRFMAHIACLSRPLHEIVRILYQESRISDTK